MAKAEQPGTGAGAQTAAVQVCVNGQMFQEVVPTGMTLLAFLREKAGFLGTKNGCDSSHCGACTVLLDGQAVYACSLLAVQADGRQVTTIEALSDGERLHPIQQAYVEAGAIQCGFCTPGMIMATKDLLDHVAEPTDFEIQQALSGNLCRCTGYTKIVQAVRSAADKLAASGAAEGRE